MIYSLKFYVLILNVETWEEHLPSRLNSLMVNLGIILCSLTSENMMDWISLVFLTYSLFFNNLSVILQANCVFFMNFQTVF